MRTKNQRVAGVGLCLTLAGLLGASCSPPVRRFADGAGGFDGSIAGDGGQSESGGRVSVVAGASGASNCTAGQKLCPSGCVPATGCCTESECKAGETCAAGVCSSCAAECPAPSRGSGQGFCEGSNCAIRCAASLTLCGDACVALDQDGQHCGACGHPCDGGLVCENGKCSSSCADGKTVCGSSCADLSNDVNHCGDCATVCHSPAASGAASCEAATCSIKCDGQLKDCAGKCVDTQSDLQNCGACGAGCAGSCVGGLCCPQGQTNCNGSCIDLAGAASNCGACGKACQKGEVCLNGACSNDCGSQSLCGSSCADLANNLAHCGSCEKACTAPANAAPVCQGSQCHITCANNFAECTPGSCTNIKTDAANCGGCGKPCGGTCNDGVCCPSGQTNCAGKCVTLQSDAKNCLTCGHVCAAGQTCDAGNCVIDCGGLTRCGQSCANLSTDPYNCKTCGSKCPAPPTSGQAICAGSAGCDIQCNTNNLRCGGACCDIPPANANAVCTSNQCAVQCKTGYHACDPASAPCYSSSDLKHCGNGCVDCTQANATVSCNGNQCANTCVGSTLSCASSNGKPACGSWEFETGTEGWVQTNAGDASSAWAGNLTTSTTRRASGTASLAIPFDNQGGFAQSGRYRTEINVPLCAGAQTVSLNGTLRVSVYLDPAAGFAPIVNGSADAETDILVYNGTTSAGGGYWNNDSGDWESHTFSTTAVGTSLHIGVQVGPAWRGTVYIDSVWAQ